MRGFYSEPKVSNDFLSRSRSGVTAAESAFAFRRARSSNGAIPDIIRAHINNRVLGAKPSVQNPNRISSLCLVYYAKLNRDGFALFNIDSFLEFILSLCPAPYLHAT